jgi:hypothetical protein
MIRATSAGNRPVVSSIAAPGTGGAREGVLHDDDPMSRGDLHGAASWRPSDHARRIFPCTYWCHGVVLGVGEHQVGAARVAQGAAAPEHLAPQLTQARPDARVAFTVLVFVLELTPAHAHLPAELPPREQDVGQGDRRQCRRHLPAQACQVTERDL